MYPGGGRGNPNLPGYDNRIKGSRGGNYLNLNSSGYGSNLINNNSITPYGNGLTGGPAYYQPNGSITNENYNTGVGSNNPRQDSNRYGNITK